MIQNYHFNLLYDIRHDILVLDLVHFLVKKNKDLLLYILERIERKKRKGRGNDKKGSGEGTPLLSDRNAFKVSVLT
jgi:hypothetical protein